MRFAVFHFRDDYYAELRHMPLACRHDALRIILLSYTPFHAFFFFAAALLRHFFSSRAACSFALLHTSRLRFIRRFTISLAYFIAIEYWYIIFIIDCRPHWSPVTRSPLRHAFIRLLTQHHYRLMVRRPIAHASLLSSSFFHRRHYVTILLVFHFSLLLDAMPAFLAFILHMPHLRLFFRRAAAYATTLLIICFRHDDMPHFRTIRRHLFEMPCFEMMIPYFHLFFFRLIMPLMPKISCDADVRFMMPLKAPCLMPVAAYAIDVIGFFTFIFADYHAISRLRCCHFLFLMPSIYFLITFSLSCFDAATMIFAIYFRWAAMRLLMRLCCCCCRFDYADALFDAAATLPPLLRRFSSRYDVWWCDAATPCRLILSLFVLLFHAFTPPCRLFIYVYAMPHIRCCWGISDAITPFTWFQTPLRHDALPLSWHERLTLIWCHFLI